MIFRDLEKTLLAILFVIAVTIIGGTIPSLFHKKHCYDRYGELLVIEKVPLQCRDVFSPFGKVPVNTNDHGN